MFVTISRSAVYIKCKNNETSCRFSYYERLFCKMNYRYA